MPEGTATPPPAAMYLMKAHHKEGNHGEANARRCKGRPAPTSTMSFRLPPPTRTAVNLASNTSSGHISPLETTSMLKTKSSAHLRVRHLLTTPNHTTLRAKTQARTNPNPQDRTHADMVASSQGNKKKLTKASVKLAALNMNGMGNQNMWHVDNKWYHLWQDIRTNKVGLMIVGESHLNDQRHLDIENLFGQCLRVDFTADPDAPTSRAGLAFVLNKTLVKTDGVKTHEIIPGRAMQLELEWHGEEPLSVLGVYAPNDTHDNAQFWRDIKQWFMNHPNVRKPDAMGGDTNKATGSQSRIDRVYVKHGILDQTYEWRIQPAGFATDHQMVTVRITSANAPTTGPGRWVWPKHLNSDKNLKEYMQEEGLKLTSQILSMTRRPIWDPEHNPQTALRDYKQKIIARCRARSKIVISKAKKEIKKCENQLELILADNSLSQDEKSLSGAVLTEKLTRLYVQQHKRARIDARIRNRLEGEVISKYWSMINKPKKPREVIHRLKKPQNPI
ncbi:hypothetical protein R3P38DRAFT_2772255 [Favolaschia claudopus]|uniref:Endonuclease/exonuclease/phosphatase domain-containing protein n=1 Tax=Favolaschia claudopus TaxID=2862362 RepID=A0AAW0C7A6_9AGAR